MSEKQITAKIRQYRKLQAQIEKLEKESEAIKDEIKAHMGETEELTAGEYKVTWKPVTSTRLDTTALKKALPDLIDRFTKTYTTRRFCIT